MRRGKKLDSLFFIDALRKDYLWINWENKVYSFISWGKDYISWNVCGVFGQTHSSALWTLGLRRVHISEMSKLYPFKVCTNIKDDFDRLAEASFWCNAHCKLWYHSLQWSPDSKTLENNFYFQDENIAIMFRMKY